MTRKALYGLLALLLSGFYLTGSLELDQDEFKAHYQQEQVSALCTASPVHHIPSATVVTLLPETSVFVRPLLAAGIIRFFPACLLRDPSPPERRFLRFRVLRL